MKTTKIFIKLLPVFLLLVTTHSFSQNPNLSVSRLINFPDTAYQGVSYNQIGITISNNDTTNSFLGSLSILIKGDSLNTDTIFNASNLQIGAGDSATFFTAIGYQFNLGTYRAGSNIVVVWPVALGLANPDTLVDSVYLIQLNSIRHLHNSLQPLSLYPNPFNDVLSIKFPDKNTIESVRIFDVTGRLVKQINNPKANKIPLKEMVDGYYSVLVTDKKGKQYFSKVLKN